MPRGRPRKDQANERHPLYSTWLNIRNRCNNPNATGYKNWGGRGIQVCSRWDRFQLFAADMGPKPSPEHWIERMDNDGDYEPLNCVWALPVQQRANQRPRQPKIKLQPRKKSTYKYERLLS